MGKEEELNQVEVEILESIRVEIGKKEEELKGVWGKYGYSYEEIHEELVRVITNKKEEIIKGYVEENVTNDRVMLNFIYASILGIPYGYVLDKNYELYVNSIGGLGVDIISTISAVIILGIPFLGYISVPKKVKKGRHKGYNKRYKDVREKLGNINDEKVKEEIDIYLLSKKCYLRKYKEEVREKEEEINKNMV